MKQYLDILQDVLQNCKNWRDNRTGIPDIGDAGKMFKHNMADGFPLLTTKQMGLKNIATELEFFIKGYTDKKWLQDRKCYIWNQWGRPSKVEEEYNIKLAKLENPTDADKIQLHNDIADKERDLGPIYGFQWRHFNGEYRWNPDNPADNVNPDNPGVDQMQNVVDKLHTNPTDRRMLVSAWNPQAISDMALPPCHFEHQVIVRDGCLSLLWSQRSCDMFLGVPYNIASYALLLLLYAKEGGYKPGYLIGSLADTHIYKNHVIPVMKQLRNKPYSLPTVEIPDENWNGIFNWKATDFVLKNYVHHEKITAEVAR